MALIYYYLTEADDRMADYFEPCNAIVQAVSESGSINKTKPEDDTVGIMGLGSGHGIMIAGARATAEAAERKAAGIVEGIPIQYGAVDEGENRIDPRTLFELSALQRKRVYLEQYDAHKPGFWAQGRDLFVDQPCWLPAELCIFPFKADREFARYHWANSSGMAAHHNTEDAERAALLELFERDALMCYWMQRIAPQKIPDKLLPEAASQLKENMDGMGYEFYTLDLTCRTVPVIMTIAYRHEWPSVAVGMGAALTYEEAIFKAWREFEAGLYWRLRNTVRHRYNGTDCLNVYNVRSVPDHEIYYNHDGNSGDVSWFWSGEELADLPQVDLTKASDTGSIYQFAKGLGIDTLYELRYVRQWGFDVVRLITPNLVPALWGVDQFPLAHPARDTCSLTGKSCSNWSSPVIPPHPLD